MTLTATPPNPVQPILAVAVKPSLDQIKARLNPSWAPIIDTLAPALLGMAGAELWSWVQGATLNPDPYPAIQALMQRVPNADLMAAWNKAPADWYAANVGNTAAMAAARAEGLAMMLRVAMGVAAILAGF